MSSWPGAFAEMAEMCQQSGNDEQENQGCSEGTLNVSTPRAASEGASGMRRNLSSEISKEQWSLHAKLANAKAKSARDSKRFERAKKQAEESEKRAQGLLNELETLRAQNAYLIQQNVRLSDKAEEAGQAARQNQAGTGNFAVTPTDAGGGQGSFGERDPATPEEIELVLNLLDIPMKFSKSSAQRLSAGTFRAILQVYTKKLRGFVSAAISGSQTSGPALQEVKELLGEAVSFGSWVAKANPTLFSSFTCGPLVMQSPVPDMKSIVDAMHLTAEQQSSILEMRRLYLSALGLLAKDQTPGLTSLQEMEEGDLETGVGVACNRLHIQHLLKKVEKNLICQDDCLCAFKEEILLEILSPMQCALAFVGAAPWFPDVMALANLVAHRKGQSTAKALLADTISGVNSPDSILHSVSTQLMAHPSRPGKPRLRTILHDLLQPQKAGQNLAPDSAPVSTPLQGHGVAPSQHTSAPPPTPPLQNFERPPLAVSTVGARGLGNRRSSAEVLALPPTPLKMGLIPPHPSPVTGAGASRLQSPRKPAEIGSPRPPLQMCNLVPYPSPFTCEGQPAAATDHHGMSGLGNGMLAGGGQRLQPQRSEPVSMPFPSVSHSMEYGVRLVGELAKSLPSRLGPEPADMDFDHMFGMHGQLVHIPSMPALTDFADPFDDLVLQDDMDVCGDADQPGLTDLLNMPLFPDDGLGTNAGDWDPFANPGPFAAPPPMSAGMLPLGSDATGSRHGSCEADCDRYWPRAMF